MISQFSLRVGVSSGFLLSQITMFGFSIVGVIAKIGQCKPTVTYWVNSSVLYFIIVIILTVPVGCFCIGEDRTPVGRQLLIRWRVDEA